MISNELLIKELQAAKQQVQQKSSFSFVMVSHHFNMSRIA
jgi:hypothetical protein